MDNEVTEIVEEKKKTGKRRAKEEQEETQAAITAEALIDPTADSRLEEQPIGETKAFLMEGDMEESNTMLSENDGGNEEEAYVNPENEPVIGAGYYPEEDIQEETANVGQEQLANIFAQLLSESGLLAQNGVFDKRKVYRASDSERRGMYNRSEKVVAARGTKIVTTEDKLRQEYEILMSAVRAVPKKIVYGRIIGVEEDSNYSLCAVVTADNTEGLYKIKIPAIELFPIQIEQYMANPEMGMKHLQNELRSRIGGHIGFTVYDLHEKERTAYASRVEAMSIDAYRWYRKTSSDGRPEIVDGLQVMAEVVSVRRDRVKVNVLGAEATILSREMSWLSLGVLTDEFHVGQQFAVRVSDIHEFEYKGANKKYVLVSIKASKKAAEVNPAELYYDFFSIGGVYAGTIKNVTETGVYVNLQDKMDCLCQYPAVGVPAKGMKCSVMINQKVDEKKFLYGIITSTAMG